MIFAYRHLGRAPIVVLVVAALIALSTLSIAPTGASAAPLAAPPTVKITSPTQNAVINGTDVTVTIDVGDAKLVPGSQAAQKSDMHVHYLLDVDPTPWIDGKRDIPTGDPNIVHSASTSYTFKNVKPGPHRVTVIVTDADHLALQPAAPPAVNFSVKLGVTIKSPATGSVVSGPDLTVTLDVGSMALVPGSQAAQKSDLHIHYLLDVDPEPWLDGKRDLPTGDPNIVHSAATSYTFKNVKPGPHRLTIILTDADHIAIQPPVAPSITFTVAIGIEWRPRAAMKIARYSLGATVGSNGRIYAIGGYSGTNELKAVEEYDPATDAWASRADMPTARSDLGVATARDGRIYAIGGFDSASRLATVEEYDPATNAWVGKANMPTARSALGVVAASNGKIYAIGGCKGSLCERVATVEEYDPTTNTWLAKANMPTARSALGVVAASNGKIYAIGGCKGNLCERVSTVEAYDPATNTWASKADMPTARGAIGVASAADGRVYVVGGSDGKDRFSRVESYDPASDTWTSGSDMPSARSDLALVGYAGGKLYVVGGYGAGSGAIEEAAIAGAQPAAPATTTTTPRTPTVAPAQTPQPVATSTQAAVAAVVPPPQPSSAPATAVPSAPPAGAAGSKPAPAPTSAAAATLAEASPSAGLPLIAVGAVVLLGVAGSALYVTRRRRPAQSAVEAQPSPSPAPAPAPQPSSPTPPGPRSGSWPPAGAPATGWGTGSPSAGPAVGRASWMSNPAQPDQSQAPSVRTPSRSSSGQTPPPTDPTTGSDATAMVQPWQGPNGEAALPPGLQLVSNEPRTGGMAAVYKAYQPSLDRFVALKVIHPSLATDASLLQRFIEEARRTAKLEHPNIVTIYDTGRLGDGSLYITMRFIDGPTVQELIARERWLSLPRAVSIAVSVGEALDYAHQRSVIHRDVKPSNILVEPSDRVTLTDFGIAILWGDLALSRPGAIIGTPRYMSPEQALGQPPDHRSDIYSLAVVLYEMLTGRPPFQAETPAALLHAHIALPPRPPQDLNPEISPAMGDLILRALAKDPSQRPQSAHQFVRDVRAAAGARSPGRDAAEQ